MKEEIERSLVEFWEERPVEWNEEVEGVLGGLWFVEGMKEEEKESFREECLETMREKTRPAEMRGLRRVYG